MSVEILNKNIGGEKTKKTIIFTTFILILGLLSLGAVAAQSPENDMLPDQVENNITNNTSSYSSNNNETSNYLPDPQVWRGGVLIYSTTTIQDALDNSLSGDTILLEDGATFYEKLVIGHDLYFNVMNGGTATIDGSGNGRIIHILPGVTVHFTNIIFQNGHAPDGTILSPDGENGGAILNEGNLHLEQCTLRNNQAGDGGSLLYGGVGGQGGAIYSTGTLIIQNTRLYENRAGHGSNGVAAFHSDGFRGGYGGAIYSTGTLIIQQSMIVSNQAGNGGNGVMMGTGGNGGHGGAIYSTGTMHIQESQINLNNAGNAGTGGLNVIIGGTGGTGGSGGAIYNVGFSTIQGSTINNNYAGNGGTGASAAPGNLINPTGYQGHQGGPGGNGGAIYNQGNLILSESEITANQAGTGGTGGAAGDGRDRNIAGAGGAGGVGGTGGVGGNGGAIYHTGNGTLQITTSSLSRNKAGTGGTGGAGGQGGNAKSTIPFRGAAYAGGAGGTGGNGGSGGAIYYHGDEGYLIGSDLSNNQAGKGGEGGEAGNGGSSAGAYSNGSGGAGGNGGNGGKGGAIYHATGNLNTLTNNLIENWAGAAGTGGAPGQPGPGTGSGTIGPAGTPGFYGLGGAFYGASDSSLHFNRLLYNWVYDVAAAPGVTVNAENNWWGSNNSPASRVTAGVNYSPWIMLQIIAQPETIPCQGTSQVTADLTWNTIDGVNPHQKPAGGHIPDHIPVSFSTTLGDIDPENSQTYMGTSLSTFTGTTVGTAHVSAQVDNQIQTTSIEVEKIDTVLSVDAVSATYLGSVDLIATLEDEFGNLLVGETVGFWVDGVYVGSAVTDSNGVATVTYTPVTLNPTGSPYQVTAEFAGDDCYNQATGFNDLTVDKASTNLTTSDVTGNPGETILLTATLEDQYQNLLEGKSIDFWVAGAYVGSALTDSNGVATLSYLINLVGGFYTLEAIFNGDDYYLSADATAQLKVPQSDLYIESWASKNNPYVGEPITITFKLGNRGPDTAENVVFTLVIPAGMEYVSAEVDQGTFTYDPLSRTITWILGDVPVGDPYLYLVVKALHAGNFIFQPQLTTDTYDPNIDENIQTVTIQAAEEPQPQPQPGVPMQTTGVPFYGLLLALVMIAGGMISRKK
ncbi:hypothetical protein HYG87_01810 [Methanobacterium alkalithermotolerans]|uniref:Big-1 domain-containing protein n=1 Tax=Methanobacterium alkalithermotolerans TaxID=2731220 RepID=A0A8T8KB12_9EURY|nr:DUF11 domain-containing protein [Methanobacterium alkalithermotolerans]QUH22591.1 hypothetical protein HYG87_01810 [Methanobacterium alkalithermotolerans]